MAGNLNENVEELWTVCHGYGELAQGFLNGCAPLVREGRILVAPEGLSRFYHRGGRGTIGASWMTKEDRLEEIADYVAYIDAVIRTVLERDILTSSSSIKHSVLGFSQGGATAARWAIMGEQNIGKLVLWGAPLPPECVNDRRLLERVPVIRFVCGTNDRVVSNDTIEKQIEYLRGRGHDVAPLWHCGGHELDPETMESL